MGVGGVSQRKGGGEQFKIYWKQHHSNATVGKSNSCSVPNISACETMKDGRPRKIILFIQTEQTFCPPPRQLFEAQIRFLQYFMEKTSVLIIKF